MAFEIEPLTYYLDLLGCYCITKAEGLDRQFVEVNTPTDDSLETKCRISHAS
jgi:hypothetical protein